MGLADWEIRLYKDSGANVGVLEADDVLVDTMMTAADDDPETPIVEDLGMYWFRVPDVPPGNYIIVEVMQDGVEQTAPLTSVTELADLGADGYAFSLTEGAVLSDRVFGNKESAVTDEPLTATKTATGMGPHGHLGRSPSPSMTTATRLRRRQLRLDLDGRRGQDRQRPDELRGRGQDRDLQPLGDRPDLHRRRRPQRPAGTAAAVDCPSLTVDPLATVTCTYEALPANATATLNTATVTAAGNLPQSDDDAIEWTENLTGYDSGDLTDPRFTYENTSRATRRRLRRDVHLLDRPDDYTNGVVHRHVHQHAPTSTATSTSSASDAGGHHLHAAGARADQDRSR